MMYAISVITGLLVGGCLAWVITSRRIATVENNASAIRGKLEELQKQAAQSVIDLDELRIELKSEQAAKVKAETQLTETVVRLEDEKTILEDAKTKLLDAFKAIASDTLNSNTASFMTLAKETFDKVLIDAKGDLGVRHEAIQGLVKPLSESLKQFDEHVRTIEKSRQEAYAGLSEQLKGVSETQQLLKTETNNLVTALRRPEVRGRWGELTLKRVVELAGMSPHCDFCEQVSVDTEEGRQRPDMIVNLPDDRQIVVDSKAPLDAYIDVTQANSEETRKTSMSRHAKQVRDHMEKLASKSYWNQFIKAPEFVVMFVAGESFFGAAVEVDSTLMEDALQKRVVIATPATLIALLRAIAYGWRQEQITENAQEISELGKQLFERMTIFVDHVVNIGKGIEKATESYNKAVGSLESRVLISARRFNELGVAPGKEIPVIDTIQVMPRSPNIKLQKEDKL
jgi:DNA recombination protein RmuC